MNGKTSITINGEAIGLKFGMEANRMFLDHIGANYFRIELKHYNEKDVAALLYAGYVNHCMVLDFEPEHKLGFFIEFVDDNMEECAAEFERVARVYEESKSTRRVIKGLNQAEDEIKKKMKNLTGTSSNLSVTENLASAATGSSQT